MFGASDDEQLLRAQQDLAAALGNGLGEGCEFELERAKMAAQFEERCQTFRRYEERLERRAKAAERRWKRDRVDCDGVAAENAKFVAAKGAAGCEAFPFPGLSIP